MDLTKLTGSGWSDGGLFATNNKGDSAVTTFLDDTNEAALTGKVSDLLSSTRMRHQRQFTEKGRDMMKSASTSVLPQSPGGLDTTATGTGAATKKVKSKKPVGRGSKVDDTAANVIERPANRIDIANLERELEVRIRAVVDIDSVSIDDPLELADPRKDGMIIIRDKLLREFGADIERLKREPWLDQLIKCECIKISCDDVAKKLIDMLSVSSVELGNVLRKLRLSYMQSFDQMRVSWQCLRATWVEYEGELFTNRQHLHRLASEVDSKETDVRKELDIEMAEVRETYEAEKAEQLRALQDSEFKMEQMGETLNSLNGIFKNMQSDGTTVRVADLDAKCDRLEKDNKELGQKVLALDKTKSDLEQAMEKIAELEKENHSKDMEIASLKQQMIRREETVVALMERESIRNAEIEKMKDITNIQGDDDDYGASMKEPSTSVLCIKCKKGLDDLSNIRAAILNKSDKAAIQCENFRVLLPNLRGRRPNRKAEWLRKCMRDIILSKMREDTALLDIKGNVNKFSAFVYSWFSRTTDFSNGGSELKTLQEADEDRWGLYYGVKAMARENDPEAVIFWTLLEERHGEDGMQFIFHCLSIAMSMGGPDLWKQLGDSLNSSATSIKVKSNDAPDIRFHVWLDVGTAIESVKAILVRALKPHVQEVVDAIYAFRVLPKVADPQVKKELADKKKEEEDADAAGDGAEGAESADGAMEGTEPPVPAEEAEEEEEEDAELDAAEKTEKEEHGEPTHICIFVWLRLMLQQMQAEQIHRSAAVRLMCESASVGALTPQLQSINDPDDLGASGMQVEYPQFSMIAKTLFPGISTLDSASLFHACYDEGRRKVTSEVLLKIADKLGLFSKAMRLSVLPLLRHEIKEGKSFEELVEGLPGPTPPDEDEDEEGAARETKESEAETATEEAAPGIVLPSEIPTSKEQLLRMRLATLIHRKMQAILPDFGLLVTRVSDRWKATLQDSRDQVVQALTHATDKIKRDKLSSNDLKAPSNHFVDGIQPYVMYRRFLATMLLVKSFSDNPLLPSELFIGQDRTVLPDFNYSFKHVENLLSNLEAGIVTSLRLDKIDSPVQSNTKVLIPTILITEAMAKRQFGSLGLSKVYRYEATRRNLVARKIQNWYRCYFQGVNSYGGFAKQYYKANVPRAVRQHMRPGYLRGMRQLKTRNVILPPWWGQLQMAEIMTFKINHDITAIRTGRQALPLCQAVSSYSFHKWASVDAAERQVQDIMSCVRKHHHVSSRLSLFAMMLGVFTRVAPRQENEGEEVLAREALESDVSMQLLNTDLATSVYINLLADIHREIAVSKLAAPPKESPTGNGPTKFLQEVGICAPSKPATLASDDVEANPNPLLLAPKKDEEASNEKKDGGEADAAPAVIADEAPKLEETASGSKEETTLVDMDQPASAPKKLYGVKTLYNSSGSPIATASESYNWAIQPSILSKAASRWIKNMHGLSNDLLAVFPEFVNQLEKDEVDGSVNVDDFAWLCMKQWAHYTSYSVHRCAARAAYAIKNGPAAPKAAPAADETDGEGMLSAMYEEGNDAPKAIPGLQPGPFTTIYLNTIVDSIYKSNEGQIDRSVDTYVATAFLKTLGDGALKAQSLKAITALLRDVTLWDSHAVKHASEQGNSASVGVGGLDDCCDSEPGSVVSFGSVARGTSDAGIIEDAKRQCSNYLPVIHEFCEEMTAALKHRQKNFSKKLPEADGAQWDFTAVKKSLDGTKLPLRSLQHIKDEELWLEKGADMLWAKIRELMANMQDLVSQTSVYKFYATPQEGLVSAGMIGAFPSDLSEISKRSILAKPHMDALHLYKAQMKNVA